jgi:prepilin-type N-terminal cleavage/methylation domain-containing protein
MRLHVRSPSRHHPLAGFTLIELLVAVSILLLLTVITVVSVDFTFDQDRVRGVQRQVQSYLAGARDRAIYANAPRGVRFLLDPENNHAVSSMVYIGAPDSFADGGLTFDPDFTGDASAQVVAHVDTTRVWETLGTRGLLGIGSRVKIDDSWYRVVSKVFPRTRTSTSQVYSCLRLDRPVPQYSNSVVLVPYEAELRATILPGSEPVVFPQNVRIDLDGSRVPSQWRPTTFAGAYGAQQYLDVLFSPRGSLTGETAAVGTLHLLVASRADLVNWTQVLGRRSGAYNTGAYLLPIVPANDPTSVNAIVTNEVTIVSVAAGTGRVSTHPVDPTNVVLPTEQIADDPFRYAEVGEVATP